MSGKSNVEADIRRAKNLILLEEIMFLIDFLFLHWETYVIAAIIVTAVLLTNH